MQSILRPVEGLSILRRQHRVAQDLAGVLLDEFVHQKDVSVRLGHLLRFDLKRSGDSWGSLDGFCVAFAQI